MRALPPLLLLLAVACGGTTSAAGVVAGPGATTEGPPPAIAPLRSPARVVETTFRSVSLNRDMPLTVYIPPGYNDGRRAMPVLYMLHGLNGSNVDWQRWGLYDTATKLIESGTIPPMLIVAPAGEGGYWMDHFNNGPRWGSYVAKDLVSYIDATYATLPVGAYRAIGGMSMGAHGALQLALNYPGEFGTVGAHSLVLRNKQQAFDFFGDRTYFARIDPVSIIAADPARARGLRLWIDMGRSDGWFTSTTAFHNQLVSLSIPHTWNAWDGGHDSTYCASHIADYLRFYGESFSAEYARGASLDN